jgi:hypothetical protein
VAGAPTARAELEFSETRAEVGDVRSGPVLSHAFRFVNQGPATSDIIDVRASCGCLTPRLERRSYAPGEEGRLVLEVNTLTQAAGPHTWRLDLRARTGSNLQDVALLLSGTLVTEVTVQPAALSLFVDRAVSEEVVVTDLRSTPFTIVAVAATSPAVPVHAGVRYRDAAGHWTCRIAVQVADDYPEGRHEETLSIYTDDPLYRELKVPLTIVKHLRQRLSAAPAEVGLQAAPGQPLPSRIVLLRDRDNQPVVVSDVQADSPAVTCQWARGPDNMATVKIHVDGAQLPAGSLRTTVHVRVSAPVPEVIDIPVSCSGEPPR